MKRILQDRWLLLLLILFFIMGPGEAMSENGLPGLMEWIVSTAAMLPGIIVGLSFHEYAHAKAAYLSGDPNPKLMGRVTLDPRAHVDPLGIFALVFLHIGWGKPVVIFPDNFKHRRLDSVLVGLAGVTMNLILACLFSGAVRLMTGIWSEGFGPLAMAAGKILTQAAVVNVSLMLFNLIPLPPLDGFNVVVNILGIEGTKFYRRAVSNGRLALLLLFLIEGQTDFLTTAMVYVTDFIMSGIFGLSGWWYLLM